MRISDWSSDVCSSDLLSGLRVVESTSFVAGPLAGMTLAQMGAEVLRLDHVRGAADAGRWPLDRDGRSRFWAGLNKGGRSVASEFSPPQGQESAAATLHAPGGGGRAHVNPTIRAEG